MMKIDFRKLKFRSFFVFSGFVLYLLLIYINFNIPIFKQLFANAFYVPTEVEMQTTHNGSFNCIAINCSTVPSVFNRNATPCNEHSSKSSRYVYNVNDREYNLFRHSYIAARINCIIPNRAYYFPLYPAWSVSNKDIPKKYWNGFLITSQIILFVLIIFLISYARVFKNKENIREIIKEDSRVYLLLSGIILVPICMALYHIFSIGELLRHYELQTNRAYRDVVKPSMFIAMLMIMLTPSFILLFKYCSKLSKIKKVVIPAISCLAIWYCTKLFNLGLIIAMRLIIPVFLQTISRLF